MGDSAIFRRMSSQACRRLISLLLLLAAAAGCRRAEIKPPDQAKTFADYASLTKTLATHHTALADELARIQAERGAPILLDQDEPGTLISTLPAVAEAPGAAQYFSQREITSGLRAAAALLDEPLDGFDAEQFDESRRCAPGMNPRQPGCEVGSFRRTMYFACSISAAPPPT